MKFALFLILVANFGFLMSMAQKDTSIPLHPQCPRKVCPRMYRPVCSSVDGRLVTEPNFCTYQIRRNCARVFRQKGRKAPVVRLQYRSACKSSGNKKANTKTNKNTITERKSNSKNIRNQINRDDYYDYTYTNSYFDD